MASQMSTSAVEDRANADHDPSMTQTCSHKTIPVKSLHFIHSGHSIPKGRRLMTYNAVSVDYLNRVTYPGNERDFIGDIRLVVKRIMKVPIAQRWKETRRVGFRLTAQMTNQNFLGRQIKMAQLDSLKILYLSFNDFNYGFAITNNKLEILTLNVFRNLPHLTHFYLDFHIGSMTPEWLQIIKSLNRMSFNKLEKLTVNFTATPGITGEILTAFGICPVRLFDLCIRFLYCSPITSQYAGELQFESLRDCKTLHGLKVAYNEKIFFARKAFFSVLPPHLKAQQDLKRLNFAICYSLPTILHDDTIIKAISEISETFPKTQELYFGLRCEYTPTTFQQNQVTDRSVEAIATSLAKFPQLRKLSLTLGWWGEATDKGLALLANEIVRHQQNLDCLFILFKGWSKITGSGAEYFASHICDNLHQLKQLAINFEDCAGLDANDLVEVHNRVYIRIAKNQKEISS